MNIKKNRITIRVTPAQFGVLDELKDAFGVSYSMLVRTIVYDFLQRNEETLDRIIDKYQQTGQPINNFQITDFDD